MNIDNKFLYGPIKDCVRLAERIRAKHANFGFELDMALLPLMREDFASAIKRTAPFLKRVQLCAERQKQPAPGRHSSANRLSRWRTVITLPFERHVGVPVAQIISR